MAVADDDWEVEQIGPSNQNVRMEIADKGDSDLVRLHHGEESVTLRVEDGVATGVDDIPEWATYVARQLGIERVV